MKPEDKDEGVEALMAWLDGGAPKVAPPPPTPAPVPTPAPNAAPNIIPVVLDDALLMKHGLTTTDEVLAYINQQLLTGKAFPCPCCTGKIKRYQRPMDAKAVRWLIFYVRYFKANPKTRWLHQSEAVAKYGQVGGDWARLRHWGLIEERPHDATTLKQGGRTTGWWRPTKRGMEFVAGTLWLPSHLQLCLGEFEGLIDKKTVSIREVLGQKFDYQKLMKDSL